MNVIENDGNPWSPVDESATSLEEIKPEVRGGNVTAHINLGSEPSEEEKTKADKAAADDSDTKEDEAADDEKTAAEVEDAEKTLAEKLAALDAAKSGKRTKK